MLNICPIEWFQAFCFDLRVFVVLQVTFTYDVNEDEIWRQMNEDI